MNGLFLTAFIFLCILNLQPMNSEAMLANDGSKYLSDMAAESVRAAKDFKPDADLNKSAWKHAKWFEFDRDISGANAHPESSTQVASLWTEKYVYFAFKCRYDVLNVYEGEDISKERWELWNRDVAEVFINPQPERITHYYEFEIAPNNQWIDLEIEKKNDPFNDASWNSNFEHATRIDEKNHMWYAELRIPVGSMKVDALRPGLQWRVNFFRAAGKGPDEQRRFLTWSKIPNSKTFHVPERFGILKFVD